jgi:hypothetical protein
LEATPVRKLGWLMVGSGIVVAALGHYSVYGATMRSVPSFGTVGLAVGGLCLVVLGLFFVQLRS